MNKKKILGVLLALTLTLVLCFGNVVTAFAVPVDMLSGTEGDPVNAVIAKELKMADGTTPPTATFTFTFAKKSVDATAVTDLSDPTNTLMPAISAKTVNFTPSDTGTTASGVITITKDTASLFNVTDFPHAGVYTYTVTETNAGVTGVTYSQAVYNVAVYIANGTSALYIAGVGTTIEKNDDGTSGSGKTSTTTPGSVTGTFRAMTFTNKYVKNNGGTDPLIPAHRTLAISKTVDGTYGDRSKYFEYSVTVTKSDLVSSATYKGYVVENGAVVSSLTDNVGSGGATTGTEPGIGNYINFASGATVTVYLKHGQTLAFIDNEVGSKYIAVEAAAADYTPKVDIIANGTTIPTINGSVNTALSTTDRLIGENANSAAFINTYKTVTPTGIAVNDLPFLMMIVLAVGAFVVFMIVKSRKRAYNK